MSIEAISHVKMLQYIAANFNLKGLCHFFYAPCSGCPKNTATSNEMIYSEYALYKDIFIFE